MTSPPIRLAFGATLWRIFAIVAVLMEWAKWNRLEPLKMMRGTGFRIAAFIFLSPKVLFHAFVVAAVVTVLLDVYVRLLMRPILARWYNPRSRGDDLGTPLAFRLSASETILGEVPARIVAGRRTRPGTLVRTDRRTWFSPFGWDAEPWCLSTADLESASSVKAPARLGSLILGLPKRLAFRDHAGVETLFVVADPRTVLRWYADDIECELDDYQPSPVELF